MALSDLFKRLETVVGSAATLKANADKAAAAATKAQNDYAAALSDATALQQQVADEIALTLGVAASGHRTRTS